MEGIHHSLERKQFLALNSKWDFSKALCLGRWPILPCSWPLWKKADAHLRSPGVPAHPVIHKTGTRKSMAWPQISIIAKLGSCSNGEYHVIPTLRVEACSVFGITGGPSNKSIVGVPSHNYWSVGLEYKLGIRSIGVNPGQVWEPLCQVHHVGTVLDSRLELWH